VDNEKPLASIIVRTKDRQELLKRALRSIHDQSCRPLEVVLVNDGGSGLNAAELKDILGDVSLNYIHLEKNRGRAAAGNAGIASAKGDYVVFLDDDDIFLPSGIASLAKAAAQYPDSVVYGSVVCRTYADTGFQLISEKTIGEPFSTGKLVLENFIPINSAFIPRNAFVEIGLLDAEFPIYEDWDMMIRLAEIRPFHHIDSVVAEYSIIGSATLTGKGGADMQNTCRKRILAKHIGKVTAHDFIDYVQRVVDRVVLEKDGRIFDINQRIGSLQDILKQKEDAIAGFQRDYEDARMHARNLETAIADLENAVREKDAHIAGAEDAVRERDSRIADLENAARQIENHITDLENALRERDERIGELTVRLNELDSLVSEILSSRSWRITGPLRAIGAYLRKFASSGR